MQGNWRHCAFSRSLTVGAALAVSVIMAASAAPATAEPVEGVISYDAATPDIDPFGQSGPAHDISGSKSATNLDADRRSNVTISLPAADYQQDYDIVLVMDATASFADAAPAAENFMSQVATDLVGRQGASIHVGAVSYATVAYSRFAAPTGLSGLVWSVFASYVRSGNLSNAPVSLPAQYQPLVDALAPVPGWPTGYLTNGGDASSYRFLLGDDTSGLVSLTEDNYHNLYDAMAAQASGYAVNSMLAYGAYTNNSMVGTLGYTMADPVIGTNLEAGLKAGQALLSTGSAPAANQYLVVLTDGGTYYWNDPTDNPAKQLSGAYFNGTNIGWANAAGDWNTGSLVSTPYTDFANFLDATAVTTDTTSQISIADWQSFRANPASYDPSGLTTSLGNRTTYPYVSVEKGTAHAATALQQIIAAAPSEHVVMLGAPYYPGTPSGAVAAKFMAWASATVDTYYPIDAATQAEDIAAAFDAVVTRLSHAIESGVLTDVIGSQFQLLVSTPLAPTDITLTLDGQPLPGVIDPADQNTINFGTPDPTGAYPYVLEYILGTSQQLVLEILVPVEVSQPLHLGYQLQLVPETSPGWHTDVPLNETAFIGYTDTDGNQGRATFPRPLTNYFQPSSQVLPPPNIGPTSTPTGGSVLASWPWAVWTGLGVLLAAGVIIVVVSRRRHRATA